MSNEPNAVVATQPEPKPANFELGMMWATSIVINDLSVPIEVSDEEGGHQEIFKIQYTWHNGLTAEQFAAEWKQTITRMTWLVKHGARPYSRNGIAPTLQAVAASPIPPAPTIGNAPVPPPPVAAQGGQLQCVMIEIAPQFKNPAAPKLLFHCNGEPRPLECSLKIESLAAMIAPLGFTPAHIVIGQKYQIAARVTWAQNGKYRNVTAVQPA